MIALSVILGIGYVSMAWLALRCDRRLEEEKVDHEVTKHHLYLFAVFVHQGDQHNAKRCATAVLQGERFNNG
jgi:hypothetical protein